MRGALSGIGAAFRRGLTTLGVDALLQRVGLAPTPPPPSELRTASGLVLTTEQVATARAARAELAHQHDVNTRQYHQQLEEINQRVIAEYRASTAIHHLPTGEIIPRDLIQTALGRQRRQYAYIVSVLARVQETGEVVTRTITVSTDRLLSPDEACREAEHLIEMGDSALDVTGSVLDQVYERSSA